MYETDVDGRYELRTIKPVSYSIPDDGPVGAMLEATGRHPWRAAHIHLLVSAPSYRPLTTEVFDSESDYLDSDAVFGVAPELILAFEEKAPGVVGATFDIRLMPAAGIETPPSARSADEEQSQADNDGDR